MLNVTTRFALFNFLIPFLWRHVRPKSCEANTFREHCICTMLKTRWKPCIALTNKLAGTFIRPMTKRKPVKLPKTEEQNKQVSARANIY